MRVRSLSGSIYRYALSAPAAAIAIGLRFALAPWLADRAALSLEIPAVMVVARFGGFGPGVLTAAFCLVGWGFCFIEPRGSLIPAQAGDVIHLGLFVAVALTISRWGQSLIDGHELSRRQADLLDAVGDAVFSWNLGPGRSISSWNRGAETLYGHTRARALGKISHELLATIFPVPLEVIEATLEREGEWSGEPIHRTADGRSIVVWTLMTLVRGALGDRTVLESNRDLTERKRAEAPSAWLATIVESSDDAIIGRDLEGRITSWNAGAERLFGYSAAEAVGRSVAFLMPPDRVHEEAELMARLREGGRIDHFESIRVAKDGRTLDVSLTISPIRDRAGGLVGISKIARDITGRKKADEAIRQRLKFQERFRLIADSVPGVICSFRMGPGGETSMPFATSAIEDLYGFPAELLAEDFTPAYRNMHVDDRGEYVGNLTDSFGRFTSWHQKFRYLHPVRGLRWIEGWARPTREPDGGVLWHGFLMDVTDSELLRAASVESERMARSILDSISSHVAVLDERGTILNVNRSWQRFGEANGAAGRDFTGANYLDVCDVAAGEARVYGEAFAAGIRDVIAGLREVFDLEYPCHPPSAQRWFVGRVTPFLGEGPRRVVVSHQDVTALKLAEERLRDNEQMLARSQFMAHVGSWDLDLRDVSGLSPDTLRWSDECYRIFGYEPGQVTVTRALFFEAVLPDDRPTITRAMARSIRDRAPYEIEHRIRRPGGEERIVHEWAEISLDVNNEPIRALGTCQDVTENRRAMEALRESDESLALAIESAGLGSWERKPAGGPIRGSPRLEALFGFAPGEFDGTAERLNSRVHPDDREGRERAIAVALETRERYQHELRVVLPDDMIRWIACYGRFTYGEDGQPVRLAGVALDISERKQAEESLKNYAARLRHLRDIDKAILSARSPHEIAEVAFQHLVALVPSWTGAVSIFDFEHEEIEPIVAVGIIGEKYPPGSRAPKPPDDTPRMVSARAGLVEVVDDVDLLEPSFAIIGALREVGLRSYVHVPLMDRGELVGTLLLGSDRPSAFDKSHVEVAVEVAGRLAVAIHQAVLFDEIRDAKGRAEDLSHRLLRAEEDERRRIARELHDEVGQNLAAASIAVDRISPDPANSARVADARDLIRKALGQVRDISRMLRPALLDFVGLAEALRALAEGNAARAGLALELALDTEPRRFDPEVEIVCYRIAQEAMTNALKHSRASRLRVELHFGGGVLSLVVADDGSGFDLGVASVKARRGASLGLLSMSERAVLVGGSVEIDTGPGIGTRVVARFPETRPWVD